MRTRIILIACGTVAAVVVALVALLSGGGGSRHSDADKRGRAPTVAGLRTIAQPVRTRVQTRRSVRLPAGSLHVVEPKLMAGQSQTTLRMRVKVDRREPGARLRAVLPKRFVGRSLTGLRFAGTPRLAFDARGRIDLTRAGRNLTVDLGHARRGDQALLAIPDLTVPAGTYRIPLQWRHADGTTVRLPSVKVAVIAGTREPVGEEVDASADRDEESETFDVVSPTDPNRVVVAANDISDASGRKGVFLSGDGGQTFAGLQFPTQLDVQGPTSPEDAELGGDPILAADRLGNVWAGGLTDCPSPSGPPSRIFVARIPAGQDSFTTTGVGLPFLHGGATSDCPFDGPMQDKPMMTIDSTTTSPTYGRLYITWDDPDPGGGVNEVISQCDTQPDPVACDDADNWSTPTVISGAPGSFITSDPAVGPDGTVYVGWWDYSGNNAIEVTKCSSNCKVAANWSAPAVLAKLDSTGGKPVPFACPIVAQPGGRAGPVTSISVDSSTGRLYFAWSDLRADSGTTRCSYNGATGLGSAPAITHRTWDSFVATAPALSDLLQGTAASRTSASQGTSVIGDTSTSSTSPDNSDDWFPWVSVDQSTGEAWVSVMSTAGDATRRTTHPYVRSVARPASGTKPTFGTLIQTSAVASDYSWGSCCQFQNNYGDYTGMTATNGFPYAVWTRRACRADDGDIIVWVPNAGATSVGATVPSACLPTSTQPPPTTTSTTPSTPTTPPVTPTVPGPLPVAPPKPGLRTSVPRQRRSVVLRRGLLVRMSCRARCRLRVRFVARVKRGTRMVQHTLVAKTLTFSGKRSLRLKLRAAARRVLRATPNRRLSLLADATAIGGLQQTTARRVSLR
jgi:hypothetical protein